ncbi:pleckstrin homology domain-containing family A member 1-like [Xenia sp. Carnegie-2017]|uniref:pleckstrin homology domain-containing family A member 1-like n=1 Tax=Xenia sp. Carnegie-2017 TaxID=2897299 RepID=UPI001F041B71|nr:pleckstrin homology domain-containing family A member 1-like [Xenia sp. Carnegie-2017]XP_046850492.1 pleckstrin homology domain-containing family A member 1-like [Xenia sp. Carnegie-2017]
MPKRDSYGRLVGYLDVENQEFVNAWRKRYVLLDETSLKFYYDTKGFQDLKTAAPCETINLTYITKVAITTSKPNAQFCFEIHKASQKWYLRSDEEQEIEEWFKALHKAVVNPSGNNSDVLRGASIRSTDSNDSIDPNDPQSATVYETNIVGGLAVKTKKNAGETSLQPSGQNSLESNVALKPIKEGYCVKQGAVVKSWKRRYLRLDSCKFCYYEKETDKEPRGYVSATELRAAKEHEGVFSNKENVFDVITPNRTYYIQAESKVEMSEWIKAFKTVIRSIKGKSTVESNSLKMGCL